MVFPNLDSSDKMILDAGKKRHKTKIELLTTTPKSEKIVKVSKIYKVENKLLPLQESEIFSIKYPEKLYEFWMNYYEKRDRKRFQRHMNRGHHVEEIVKATLRKHKLPQELFYVGLIESGYSERISSSANAVGPWQFIKGTATRYGLRVDRHIDERFNIIKASEASAQYFKDLYNIFGSWELALSAYNAGEYRIINAIRRGNTRDYRELVRKKLLPRETINYVPKLMAAKKIYDGRKHYGFTVPRKRKSGFIDSEISLFKSSFSLSKVAKKLGVSHSKLKKINPDVKTGWVHIRRGKKHRLIVPASFKNKAQRLAKSHTEKDRRPKRQRLTKLTSRAKGKKAAYKVQKGDNLSRIARMFNTNIKKIKRVNKLRGSRVYAGQRIQIPNLIAKIYIVRRGDNLGRIARKFNTSISSIKGLNSLRNSKIYPKQRIQVPIKG